MGKNPNRQWRVASHPLPGELLSADNFEWTAEQVPEPADGEFLVRVDSLAPMAAMRGYLDKSQAAFLGPPIPAGEVMRGRGVGEIVASKHPGYKPGEIFVGSLGWQDYSLQRPIGKDFIFSTRKINKPREPLSLHMGILGQAGGTAYFGLTEGGQLQAGDNVLVSGAAGGVGSVAGQIARIKGANSVVGVAGSDEKCAWLCDELGFTAAINYKTENVDARLETLFPDGIDLYYDNVGGETLDTALKHIAMHARIVIAGHISTQYSTKRQPGPANYSNLLFKRGRMQGYIYFDYWDRYDEAQETLSKWHDDGLLVNTEYLTEGLENMPAAVADLFTGGNKGIAMCRVAT